MKINICYVGKIKEKYFLDAIEEYKKRISKYAKVELYSVKDEMTPQDASEALENQIKDIEGERLLNAIPSNSYKVVLDLKGEMLTSVELASKIDEISTYNNSNISFIIGGSLGLSKKVLNIADYHLCFSKMTFPHKLMQVILLEQIYRAFKINNHETYHK